jgi:hypothetical protein
MRTVGTKINVQVLATISLPLLVLSLNLWRRTLNDFLLFIGRPAVQTCSGFRTVFSTELLIIRS